MLARDLVDNSYMSNATGHGQMFKKGDNVWILGSWDGKGTVSIRKIIIQSWGAKQGTAMIAVNGKMTKTRFYTDADHAARLRTRMFEVGTVDIESEALRMGAEFLTHQREHCARCLATSDSEGYTRAITKELNALHEPRVIYPEVQS